MKNQKDFSKIYKTRSKASSGSGVNKLVVLDQEIPAEMQKHMTEPKVTEQLLDLNQTSMNMFSKDSKSVTQRLEYDLLTCTVSGAQEVAVVAAWEYKKMQTGKEFQEGGFLPPKYSPIDLFDEDYKETKVHSVIL